MTIEHQCPLCHNGLALFQIGNVGGYALYGCHHCQGEHVFPPPNEITLKTYYDRQQWFEGGEPGGYEDYEQQTAWSVDAIRPVLKGFDSLPGKSILDVGCGYGTHLELAAELGLKCFGVELSDYARKKARERLGTRAYIVERVTDLIPHAFDMILMLDVIEHLPEPYTLLYHLFSIGAIANHTRLIVTTPNAGSSDAQRAPLTWTYRHPPSHLTYYRAETLTTLFRKLLFKNIDVQGINPLRDAATGPLDLANYGGLMLQADGSSFGGFMHERYVPGTWSKVAEYEHMPRYELAKLWVPQKAVLDFGCGTGYGAALLAKAAALSVTGLDISFEALTWAREEHTHAHLTFYRCNDLGAQLPADSFDVVTCFEMIEHVPQDVQKATLTNIRRLLRRDGVLLISTPNPEFTKLYGENPYHAHEMALPEFQELLRQHFSHVRILSQRVLESVTFQSEIEDSEIPWRHQNIGHISSNIPAVAFIAICSDQPIDTVGAYEYFSDSTNPVLDFLVNDRRLNNTRFELYQQLEQVGNLQDLLVNYRKTFNIQRSLLQQQSSESNRLESVIRDKDAAVVLQTNEIQRLESVIRDKDAAVVLQANEIQRLESVIRDKDAAVVLQTNEIQRLESVIRDKDAAVVLQTNEIQRLESIVRGKNATIFSQTNEIQRLESAIPDKNIETVQQSDKTSKL